MRTIQLKVELDEGKSKAQARILANSIAAEFRRINKELKVEFENFGGNTRTSTTRGNSIDTEFRRAQTEIRKYQQENIRAERQLTAQIEKEARQRSAVKIREAKRSANETIREIERVRREEQNKNSGFSEGFGSRLGVGGVSAGVLVGGLAAGLAAGAIIGIAREFGQLAVAVKDVGVESVQLAANFQRTRNALSAIAGSSAIARNELASLEKLARNTPGLGLEAAEGGLLRLRAVGFEAAQVEDTLVGLSRVKILSGGTKQDLEAVLYNLTQIKSTGKLTGDELRETLGRLPAIAPVIQRAFGTISTEKIKELNLSSEDFFRRFNASLKEVPPIAGGATDAWDKLTDEILKGQRAFGEPILQPVTEGLQDLTVYLRENKAAWASWGKSTADSLIGAIDLFKAFEDKVTNFDNTETESGIDKILKFSVLGYALPLRILKERGEQIRKIQDAAKDIKPGESTFVLKTDKAADDAQVRNYKQTFDRLEQSRQNDLRRVENYYERQANLASAGIRQTTAQELEYQEKVSGLRQAQSSQRLNILAKEIDNARTLNEKLIQTFKPEDQNNIRQTKHLELVEKEIVLEREIIKTQGERIAQQNTILELQQRIAEAARQAANEFKQLQIQGVQQFADSNTNSVKSSLEQGLTISRQGYDELINLTQNSYQAISKLTLEGYQTQLQSLSLTKEQRRNLTTQMFLDEQKLAEDNSRKISDIQQEQFANFVESFKSQAEQIRKSSASRGQLFSQFGSSFFKPDIRFGEGFNNFGTGIFDTETQTKLQEKLNSVLAGRSSIYQFQKELLGKTHSAERENLGREIDLVKDLIKYEEIRLKSALRTNVINAETQQERLKERARKLDFDRLPEDITINAEIESLQKRINEWKTVLASGDAAMSAYFATHSNEVKNLNSDVKTLQDTAKSLFTTQGEQKTNLFAESTEGLKEFYAALVSGQKNTIVQQISENQLWKERTELVTENLFLQERINNVGFDSAERYQNAWLTAIYAVKDANIQAVESQIESQVRLADASTIHIEQVRARVLEHLASAKDASTSLADGIISAFEKVASVMDKSLGKIGDIPILGDLIKFSNRSFLSNITTTLVDKFFPPEFKELFNKTNNPIARPIVDKLDEIKQVLNNNASGGETTINIPGLGRVNLGGSSVGGQQGGIGNLFGDLLKKLLGGGGFGSGGGIGGTPNFNSGGGNLGYFFNALQQMSGGRSGGFSGGSPGNFAPGFSLANAPNASPSGGGIISQIFGKGGLFGAKGFGFNAGTVTGIGALTSIAGGFLPGKAGSVLSGIGSGIGIGATIGSIIPGIGTLVGAIVGGAIGFFSSLFSSPKQKQDKNEKLPALQQGFADALKALQELARNKRAIQQDPSGAKTQADSLYSQIASGFGITFASSKYKKIALQQIEARKTEAKILVDQIKEFAKRAETAQLRPILPEFQSGNYFRRGVDNQMADMRRMLDNRRGLIVGSQPGVDRHLGYFADEEMILNKRQQHAVIAVAGQDVFEYANIPNYPKRQIKKYADGNYFGTITPATTVSPGNMNVNIYLEGDITAKVKDVVINEMSSERGINRTKVNVQVLRKNKEI